jgi:hypothetical protein
MSEFSTAWADIDIIKRRIEGSRSNGKDVVLVEHAVMERLLRALEDIAKQNLRTEMDEDLIEGINADWENGYESCVRCAREALGI